MDLVKKSFLKALFATILVLSIGVLVGLQADDARKDFVKDQLQESTLRSQTFLVTQNYLEESSKNYCQVVEDQIPEISEQNTEIGRNLQSFSGKSISNQQDYDYLKRKYYVNQLRLYNVIKEYNERCDENTTLIFYFFDKSTDSRRQGAALTKYYREVDQTSYIFSYNMDAEDSAIVELLKSDYNIQEGPVVVINGNQTYRRYVPYGELRQVIGNNNISNITDQNNTTIVNEN